MTSTSNHQEDAEHVRQAARGPGRRRFPAKRAAVTVAVSLGLGVLAAGCGGNPASGSSASSSRLLAEYSAYSRCMRSHGVPNFPDPSTSGGIGITLPHSFNTRSPAYLAASRACHALAPVGHPATGSPDKIAAEVKVARCMRAHGDPSFPDPNGQSGFDRSKFDKSSPAFKTAANACKSLIAAMGSIPVAQGSN